VLHARPDAITAMRVEGEPEVRVLSAAEWRRRLGP
jgi:hypothetical protein